MKVGKQFNTLTLQQYIFYIDNHKKFTDFNTLGLYRSIVENEKLTFDEKISIREYAHQFFKKSFDFLQVKDPQTFFDVTYLGQEMTKADKEKLWEDIRKNQQKMLADKKIKHRNFGIYSKHTCGYDTCKLDGIMVKQGSAIADGGIWYLGDRNRWAAQAKSVAYKADRKRAQQIIQQELDNE
jgi:hypothetical protein